MLLENAFKCTYTDCLKPCMTVLFVTLILMLIIHIYAYYRVSKLAEEIYGDEPLMSPANIDGKEK